MVLEIFDEIFNFFRGLDSIISSNKIFLKTLAVTTMILVPRKMLFYF